MPEKQDPYTTPGVKVLGLYCLFLFSGRSYSLTRLSKLFHCSKQSVIRYCEQIQMRREIELESYMEGRERYYRVKTPARPPNVSLDLRAVERMMLCRDIVAHLLPQTLQAELEQSIGAAMLLAADGKAAGPQSQQQVAESWGRGTIDYSAFQRQIDAVLQAVREKRLCRVQYRKRIGSEPKTYLIAPLRLVAYREALYLRSMPCDETGAPQRDAPINLALHRVVGVEPTETPWGDYEQALRAHDAFGFPFNAPFRVKVRFSEEVATYIHERTWSRDQEVTIHEDGSLTLAFTSISRPEARAWILGFGKDAEVLAPEDLRDEVIDALRAALAVYEPEGGAVRATS